MQRAKFFATPLLVLGALAFSPVAAADEAASADATSTAGGLAAEVSAKSTDLTKLAAALTAAGLADTLGDTTPFTVFAPTDQAFAAVPQPMTDWLMSPDNTESLAKVLRFHVVPGRVTAEDIYKKIKAGGGTATLTTVEGEPLTFTEVEGNIRVEGTQGSSGFVTKADLEQSNGLIHVINGVLVPTFG